MTTRNEVLDEKAIPCLDHGFVRVVDSMGNDAAIVQAARVSYGAGTKTVREDRGLIRYLVRHRHTSPLEMCQVKLHIRCPIFVFRQMVRHRTASVNEYSGRYSVMTDEFYVPERKVLQPQSTDNKQGRAGELSDAAKDEVIRNLNAHYESSYHLYQDLLGSEESRQAWKHDVLDNGAEHPFGLDEYPGVAREIARIALPVSNYTELYWSQNLHNLLHLLKLRSDKHAQHEIRVFADAIYDLIKPLFPLAVEAWVDYVQKGVTVSRMEKDLIRCLMHSPNDASSEIDRLIEEIGSLGAFADKFGMSIREVRDFCRQWKINLNR
jgi:thymidylate synthase (FAD)